jgi:hypothetical protein
LVGLNLASDFPDPVVRRVQSFNDMALAAAVQKAEVGWW